MSRLGYPKHTPHRQRGLFVCLRPRLIISALQLFPVQIRTTSKYFKILQITSTFGSALISAFASIFHLPSSVSNLLSPASHSHSSTYIHLRSLIFCSLCFFVAIAIRTNPNYEFEPALTDSIIHLFTDDVPVSSDQIRVNPTKPDSHFRSLHSRLRSSTPDSCR